VQQLRSKLVIRGAIFSNERASNATTLAATWCGTPRTLGLCDRVDDSIGSRRIRWTLWAVDRRADGAVVARLRSDDVAEDGGEATVVQAAPADAAAPPPPEDRSGRMHAVPLDDIAQELTYDPVAREWIVPHAEIRWWETWGVNQVVTGLKTRRAAGGVELLERPGRGTAVHEYRGLDAGDVIRSVNGVPVASMLEILDALARAKTDRVVVVIERGGLPQEVVFRLLRPPGG
jgi:hypothetical protein